MAGLVADMGASCTANRQQVRARVASIWAMPPPPPDRAHRATILSPGSAISPPGPPPAIGNRPAPPFHCPPPWISIRPAQFQNVVSLAGTGKISEEAVALMLVAMLSSKPQDGEWNFQPVFECLADAAR